MWLPQPVAGCATPGMPGSVPTQEHSSSTSMASSSAPHAEEVAFNLTRRDHCGDQRPSRTVLETTVLTDSTHEHGSTRDTCYAPAFWLPLPFASCPTLGRSPQPTVHCSLAPAAVWLPGSNRREGSCRPRSKAPPYGNYLPVPWLSTRRAVTITPSLPWPSSVSRFRRPAPLRALRQLPGAGRR
jgi:hypothetical protein